MPINIGPLELALSLNTQLPAAGANVTTGTLDFQSIAPNGDAWRLGRIAVIMPAIAGNTAGAGITIALQSAPPSLVAGSLAIAPQTPPAGAFVTPAVSQTLTVAPVANGGSTANIYYFTLPFDSNGSPYEFVNFVITTPAQVQSQSEIITIGYVEA
jgi:hypothetical protein